MNATVPVAARRDRAPRHLGLEGSQLHRVRAVDDEIGKTQHRATMPQDRRTLGLLQDRVTLLLAGATLLLG